MNVEMPDGTVIEDVPDGITRSELMRRYKKMTPQRTATQEPLRQLGLAARQVVEGAAGVPAIFANALGAAANLGAGVPGLPWSRPAARPTLSGLITGQPPSEPRLGTDAQGAVSGLLDRAGLPKEETDLERGLGAVSRAVAGGGAGIRAAAAVPGEVSKVMTASPGMQLLSNATGAGAAEIARQSDVGPAGQLVAGLAGGFAPSAVQGTLAASTRGILRTAGEKGADAYNLRRLEWERTGRAPTVGQASGTRVAQGLDSVLSKAPGGAGVYAKTAEEGAEQMRRRVDAIAGSLAANADPARAGLTVERGAKAFVDRFKLQQKALYEIVDRRIPKGTQVDAPNTRRVIGELNADIEGAPALSQWFKNAKIVGLEDALTSDVAAKAPKDKLARIGTEAAAGPHGRGKPIYLLGPDGNPLVAGQTPGKPAGIPYEALAKLRTLVGNEITNNSLTSDIPRSKWKALYAALSDDMGSVASAAGPQATAAWQRANWFSRAGYDRIESVLDRVTGDRTKTAEQIFSAATSGTKEGATTINAVMRSLLPDERKVVTAAVVNKLGRATSGNQNAAGDVFSSETFLTNWNNVSDPAKRILFADPTARRGLDDLALAAERIRQGSKVFANPSGTSGGVAQLGTWGGLGASLATGNVGTAALILGGVGANFATAKLLTNPRFVAWVGKTTRMPAAAFPSAVQMLAQQAKNWPEDERQGVQEFIGTVGR
jgi:hypothetical protein